MSADIYWIRAKLRERLPELFYNEHYSIGENSQVLEGINLVLAVLSDVTGVDFEIDL